MNLKRTIGTALLALTLVPAYVAAAEDMELKATVVSKGEKEIKVKTKDDEKTILVGSKTKGLENAKEGSKVTIKYTEKEGQLRATCEDYSPQRHRVRRGFFSCPFSAFSAPPR